MHLEVVDDMTAGSFIHAGHNPIPRIGSGPIKFKQIMNYTKIKRKKIKNILNLMCFENKLF
jgi:hypothetical protein